MPYETIELDIAPPIAHIELNRPERLNAIDGRMLDELVRAADEIDGAEGVRVAVLSGRGRAFSAGADRDDLLARVGEAAEAAAAAGRTAADRLEALSVPLVAKLHGHVVGGAVVLALTADVRIAARNTRFAIPEVDLGIPLLWGGLPRLVRDVGFAVARDLILTCRVVDADEAQAVGLVTRVVDDDRLEAEASHLVSVLAAKPPQAVAATREHFRTLSDPLLSAVDEAEMLRRLLGTAGG